MLHCAWAWIRDLVCVSSAGSEGWAILAVRSSQDLFKALGCPKQGMHITYWATSDRVQTRAWAGLWQHGPMEASQGCCWLVASGVLMPHQCPLYCILSSSPLPWSLPVHDTVLWDSFCMGRHHGNLQSTHAFVICASGGKKYLKDPSILALWLRTSCQNGFLGYRDKRQNKWVLLDKMRVLEGVLYGIASLLKSHPFPNSPNPGLCHLNFQEFSNPELTTLVPSYLFLNIWMSPFHPNRVVRAASIKN